MITEYIYALERGSRTFLCPKCNKKKMVRYLNKEIDEYLPIRFGRCNRESNCGYHKNPYTERFNTEYLQNRPKNTVKFEPKKNKYIPFEILQETLKDYENNSFIQNLHTYPIDQVNEVRNLYYLGTISHGYRKGGITFPFIDIINHVRAIQVKQFDKSQKTTSTDFLHSIIYKFHLKQKTPIPEWLKEYKQNDKIVSCLFGEHLLKWFPNNPIALVEAPKTAIYGTLNFGFPERTENFIWLAVYNLSSLNYEKCKVLKGRKVILYPDTSEKGTAFSLWNDKAKYFNEVMPDTKFMVSEYLETNATEDEKKQGLDLADYLNQTGLIN